MYTRAEAFVIENLEWCADFFENQNLKYDIVYPYKDSDTKTVELVNNRERTYRFYDFGKCDILFDKVDAEKKQEVNYTISYYEREDNIRIRIRSQGIGSGYNDYPLDDLSTPVYGPVTDDGQENQWDYYIKKYVTEEELYDILEEMHEYKGMFQALLDEWEAKQE